MALTAPALITLAEEQRGAPISAADRDLLAEVAAHSPVDEFHAGLIAMAISNGWPQCAGCACWFDPAFTADPDKQRCAACLR